MLTLIQEVLSRAGVEYIIREEQKETAELFFIRHRLDMRRLSDVKEWRVTVYVRAERDGKPMMGSASATVFPNTTPADVDALCARLKSAAGYALNPAYALYTGEVSKEAATSSGFNGRTLEQSALSMADAIMKADDGTSKAFVNTAEIFMCRTRKRVVSSTGTDVCSVMHECNGEYVVQCKEPVDAEQFFPFRYLEPDAVALENEVRLGLNAVTDRANAKGMPVSGTYDVLIGRENLRRLFGYYVSNASAESIYPHHSDWQEGTLSQGVEIAGEPLQLDLLAEEPFSDEGIPMHDRPLIRDGKVVLIHGGIRLCRYLGIEPTGEYRRIGLNNGTVPFDELKKNCLYPVSFSDFRCDPFTGSFGGEIRLGYYFDAEGNATAVTGGSVNGNIKIFGGAMLFSREQYADAGYRGPMVVRIPGAAVAGRENG